MSWTYQKNSVGVHNVFPVSNLKKCLADESLVVPLEELHIDEQLHFVEQPVEIMDREVKTLKHSKIPIVPVRWNSKRGPEYTWQREDQMMKKYPQLFQRLQGILRCVNFRDESSFNMGMM